jgi:IS30 family transposase
MTYTSKRRRSLTPSELNTLWAAWKDGANQTTIAELLAVPLTTVSKAVLQRGGIAPAPRTRSSRALSSAEREEISRGLAAQERPAAIARRLGRHRATIGREIQRNGTPATYRAATADRAAWRRAERPKPGRLAESPRLRHAVAAGLARRWSPEQIAHWLMATYPDDPTMRVSHETIYSTLYVQTRGTLKKELLAYLRRRQRRRQSRAATKQGEGRGRIVDAVSISERPPAVEDRTVPGHWEGDLLAGAKNSHIATLVERTSRYVHLVKVAGKDTESVVTALLREVQRLPTGLMASLTWDRGTELAQHQLFSMVSDVAVYFCDPHSPWQRGSNENTNGLLRQYFPHGTDLRQFTQRQLDAVARQLNTRPRQTLGWKTPAAVLANFVASIG